MPLRKARAPQGSVMANVHVTRRSRSSGKEPVTVPKKNSKVVSIADEKIKRGAIETKVETKAVALVSETKVPTGATIHEALPYTLEGIMALLGIKSPPPKKGETVKARVIISPSIAEKIKISNTRNRRLSKEHLAYVGEQMSANWAYNGEAMKFDWDGMMLDGQHRNEASIISGHSFETDVILGLDPASQITMDSGRKRTNGDNLTMLGFKYGAKLSATLRWIRYIVNNDRGRRVSTPDIIRFCNRYPQIKDSVSKTHSGDKLSRVSGVVQTQVAALHFIATEFLGLGDRADAFVRVFKDEDSDYPGDPAHHLRKCAARAAGGRTPFSSVLLLHMSARAWNDFAERRPKRNNLMSPKLEDRIVIEGLEANMVEF